MPEVARPRAADGTAEAGAAQAPGAVGAESAGVSDDTQALPRIGGGRPLIGNPGTTEIPVHLLFRDQEPEGRMAAPATRSPGFPPASVPRGPGFASAPVTRGSGSASAPAVQGSGSAAAPVAGRPGVASGPAPRGQGFASGSGSVAGRLGSGNGVGTSRSGLEGAGVPRRVGGRGPVGTPAAAAPRPTPARPAPTPAGPAPARRAPGADPELRERRGPALPGWVGALTAAGALAGCGAVLARAGLVPHRLAEVLALPAAAEPGRTHWVVLAALGVLALVALGGLGRGRAGHAWVLSLFGSYRGTVRRTGLVWVSPLLLRRRVDVRLRHWRSEPLPAVDAGGLALRVVVHVVWRVRDTARAEFAVEDHTEYLAEQVESALARVLSQLPADAFHEDAPTLRDAEAVGDALTRVLAADTEVVGIEVYSAQPTRIEYAPEVAAAMQRRRVAAIDAKHRDAVLSSVVDAVDDTVHRLTSRGLVELDDYERKALVKDLTVAFYTGRQE
ncbi:SPFH domain-containing protein [Streptomyces sp. NPDC093225]|uniref:SPFH domain-containing protein n=1 Tax=Streptomyces sp. NPDC093225 TaxID=3366034 RepID=UPI0037F9772E